MFRWYAALNGDTSGFPRIRGDVPRVSIHIGGAPRSFPRIRGDVPRAGWLKLRKS